MAVYEEYFRPRQSSTDRYLMHTLCERSAARSLRGSGRSGDVNPAE